MSNTHFTYSADNGPCCSWGDRDPESTTLVNGRRLCGACQAEEAWLVAVGGAICDGCGESALRAFPQDEAPAPGVQYTCFHCVLNRMGSARDYAEPL